MKTGEEVAIKLVSSCLHLFVCNSINDIHSSVTSSPKNYFITYIHKIILLGTNKDKIPLIVI